MSGRKKRLVVICTALRVEFEAMCAFLTHVHDEMRAYRRGVFSDETCSWDVVVIQTGQGGEATAAEATHAFNLYKPELMLFVGVAGGRKDVVHGDIVVATKIYAYEPAKDDKTLLVRPLADRLSLPLELCAEAEARTMDWLKRLGDKQPDRPPKVYMGPIAAGSRVVTSLNSATEKLLQKNFNDALAVDMESHGFAEAVYRMAPPVAALVIRGISDVIKDKATIDNDLSQRMAARHASAFAIQLLARLGSSNVPQSQPASAYISTLEDEPVYSVPLSLQKYCAMVEETMHNLFDGGLTVHSDQCRRAIHGMDSLLAFFEPGQKPPLSSVNVIEVKHIRTQIRDLKLALQTFDGEDEKRRQEADYLRKQESVQAGFKLLLKSLKKLQERM